MKKEELHKLIYSYPSKYQEGLLREEVEALLTTNFTNLSKDEYNRKVGFTKSIMKKEGHVTYHSDVFYGIVATLENRELNSFEID
jgi:hypothetical protein